MQEAAEVLGTSVDAVRMRIRRGSLELDKEPGNRVHVRGDSDSAETKLRPDGETTVLVFAKVDPIHVLCEQIEAEREASREARRIIAGLVQRIPELKRVARADDPTGVASSPQSAGDGAEIADPADSGEYSGGR
jgi:hypothetical protein